MFRLYIFGFSFKEVFLFYIHIGCRSRCLLMENNFSFLPSQQRSCRWKNIGIAQYTPLRERTFEKCEGKEYVFRIRIYNSL